MNKDDLLKLLEELNFPKDQFYILSSGCLVFYNLRDMANDLDLCITENLFEQIKNKYDLVMILKLWLTLMKILLTNLI